jgi:autotransporter-associated beta strand protein/T5SS/PEP-CTERM-associated repeat protein
MTGRYDYSAGRTHGGFSTEKPNIDRLRRSLVPSGAARRLLRVASSTLALMLASPVLAADWLGTTSTDWFTAGNWSPAAVPTASVDVTIDNGGAPNPATIGTSGAVAKTVTIGAAVGQSGTLNVTGGTLSGVTSVTVGDFGTGTLNISNGGTVSASSVYLAVDPGGSGTVTVSGAGSKLTPTSLYLGMDAGAVAQVTIGNEASLVSSVTVLGYFTATSSGTLTVTGATATTGGLTIGERGVGVFNLNGGATGTSGSVSFGSNATGNGTATISGAGTTWTTGGMNIGGTGTGALTISAGAEVSTTQSNAFLAPVFLGGTATVTGTGSKWTITGDPAGSSQAVLAIGTKANNTGTLLVADGGALEIVATASGTNGNFQQIRLGVASGTTGAITVTGTGSSFTTPYDIWAGYNSGTTGRITVSAGGTLDTGFTIVGASGAGNATVTGTASVWTVSDTPFVPGGYAQGLWIANGASSTGTLTIADGGTVKIDATGHSLRLGGSTGSQATLNIGAAALSPAVAPGTLTANSVIFATGATSTINFNHNASDYIFAVGIQGTGGTVNFLSGTTILAGGADSSTTYPNSYTGATNVAAGATAQFGNGGTTGLISGNIANDGTVAFKLSGSSTYAGVISGTGTMVQRGSGTLTLTGSNTFSGLTTISSGTLQLGNGGTTGTLAGDIANNSHLTFNRSSSFTYSKQISGTGDVTKSGSGVLTLASAQSYSGGTSVQQGTLRLGADSRLLATGSLFLFSNGTFDLNGFAQTVGDLSGPGTVAIGTGAFTAGTANNRSFAGRFTGSGGFTKAGSGTLTLTGDNSGFTGATTVAAGTLLANANLSNSAVMVLNGATLGGSGTVGDVIVASGGTLAGTEEQTLTTGDLTLASGSVVSARLAAAGNSTGLFTVNGNLTLDGTLNATDAGGFGQGLYRLIDYTGALTDNGLDIGALPLNATGSVQTSVANQINLVVDEIPANPFIFWDGANATANNIVDGGSGTWSATGTNWTTVAADENGVYDATALLIFAGTAGTVTVDGDVAGSLALGAGLQFADTGFVIEGDDLALGLANTNFRVGDGTLTGAAYLATIASNLTGPGGLDKTDLGTLILTGTNSYAGLTTVAEGTLQLGNGGSSGSVAGDILNHAELVFARSDDMVFGGVLSGTGATRFTGTGMTTLTADSSGFAGDVLVSGGNLRIVAGGSLGASLLDVAVDGTLSGLGTIAGPVSVLGTLAPGEDALGTLTIAGDVDFDAGSTFQVRIAANGDNDAVATTTASLGGAVRVSAIDAHASYLDGQTYTILTTSAGTGVSGSFAGATMLNDSAFLTPTLNYGANNVVLTVAVTSDFTSVTDTYNQTQAAGALNDLAQTGDALTMFNALAMLDPHQARTAFDLSSGEVHAAGQHVIDQTFALLSRTLRDRARPGRAGGADDSPTLLGYAPNAPSMPGVVAIDDATLAALLQPAPTAWVTPLGGRGEIEADGNASALDWKLGGLAAGYEAPVDVATGTAWFGFGMGYLGSRGTVDDLLSTYDTEDFGLGAYGGWTDGPWSLSGSLAYMASSIATSRTIAFGDVDRIAAAQYWAHSVGVSGEVAYSFDVAPEMTLSPLATLDAGWSGHDGFDESGAGALDLSGEAESWSRFDVGIGVALAYVMPTEVGLVNFEGRVVWEHGFADAIPSQSMMFDGSPTRFSVRGPDAGQDRLHVGAGLSLDISDDMSLSARYDGRFSADQVGHAATFGLNIRF